MAQVDNTTVNIGDVVFFKCDTEQAGTISRINGSRLTLTNESGFRGEYIGGDTTYTVSANECWLEG